jgi:hypothetical protein
MQLMIAIRFYATGTFQEVLGDVFGVSKGTVSNVLRHVSETLAHRTNEFVFWLPEDD